MTSQQVNLTWVLNSFYCRVNVLLLSWIWLYLLLRVHDPSHCYCSSTSRKWEWRMTETIFDQTLYLIPYNTTQHEVCNWLLLHKFFELYFTQAFHPFNQALLRYWNPSSLQENDKHESNSLWDFPSPLKHYYFTT